MSSQKPTTKQKKYTDSPTTEDTASASSAILLSDNIEPEGDVLPAYSDDPSTTLPLPDFALGANSYEFTGAFKAKDWRGNTSQRTILPKLSNDPNALHALIIHQAGLPPQPLLHIVGTHQRKNYNRKEGDSETVTDFNFHVDLTPYIVRSSTSLNPSAEWDTLKVVENEDSAYRGGWRKSTAKVVSTDEEGVQQARHLGEWTQAYCDDKARLKTFTLSRVVSNHDQAYVLERIKELIRNTCQYRGNLAITFTTNFKKVEVWSPDIINSWRNNCWVRILFYITFLWLCTWPILFFMTRRYEVVSAVWPYAIIDSATQRKRYAVLSEEEWVRKYAPAIKSRVMSRGGGYITEGDVNAACAEEARSGDVTGLPEALRRTEAMVPAMFSNAVNGLLGGERDLNVLRGWGYDE